MGEIVGSEKVHTRINVTSTMHLSRHLAKKEIYFRILYVIWHAILVSVCVAGYQVRSKWAPGQQSLWHFCCLDNDKSDIRFDLICQLISDQKSKVLK